MPARAEYMLDRVCIELAGGRLQPGLMLLLTGLADIRQRASRAEWRRFSDEIWVRHPVSSQFLDQSIRKTAMRVGGPRAGLAALLSLLGDRAQEPAPPRRRP